MACHGEVLSVVVESKRLHASSKGQEPPTDLRGVYDFASFPSTFAIDSGVHPHSQPAGQGQETEHGEGERCGPRPLATLVVAIVRLLCYSIAHLHPPSKKIEENDQG